MTRLLGIAAALFFLFLAAPLLHWATGLPPDVPLAGVEAAVRPPVPSLGWWWTGDLQTEFDAWLNARIGLRGLLVRTAHQLQFSLFGELPRRGGTQTGSQPRACGPCRA